MRDRYLINKDSILKKRKERRSLRTKDEKTKDSIYHKKYREMNKDLIKEKRSNVEYRYSQYKSSANRRGYKFELSIHEFDSITKSLCEYCGINSGGIDRVNNQIGYIKSNVVPCCEMCNKMKWRWDKDEFIRHVNLIANHNKTT